MGYQIGLDGLRGLAVLLVLLFHSRAPIAYGGYIGVDLFFVLSGFLITSILLVEFKESGRVNVWRFYARRFMRLSPALLLMLCGYLLAAPLMWPERTGQLLDVVLAGAYLADYAVAFWGLPDLLGHTWSLAVEEHFYLLWPIALWAICRRWRRHDLVAVLAAAYVLATVWRWFCLVRGQSWEQIYYRFDTRLSGLLLGALLAAAQQYKALFRRLTNFLPGLLWFTVVFGILCLRSLWGDPWMLEWGITAAELCGAALILAAQDPKGQITAMLSARPLIALGKLSYGIYLWHYPIFRWLRPHYRWDEILLIGIPLSVSLAALSYFTVEAWARRWRSRESDIGRAEKDDAYELGRQRIPMPRRRR
jgi:peptidoglycan/LPS O-acetylase OafA/YrhL